MKKQIRSLLLVCLAAVLVLGLCACAEKAPEVAGGWTEQNGELSAEDREAFDKAVAGTEYEGYTVVSLLGTQVVAGLNYRFLCTDESGAKKEMVVYRDLQGVCSVTEVTDPA